MRTFMARLGAFQFGIDTAAFQKLQRAASYQWQAKNRIGRKPAQQFTGQGADTITLDGVIYPHYRGGLGQIGRMRQLAGTGQPQALIYAFENSGQYCGRWCITNIEENRTVFFEDGKPRKIEFSLSLVEYGDDAGDPVAVMASAITAAAGASTVQLAPGLQQAFAGIKSLTTTVAANAGAIAGSLAGHLAKVQELGASLGTQYNTAVGAITRSIDAATGVKGTGDNVLKLLGDVPEVNKVTTAAQTVSQESGRVVGIAARSSGDLNNVFNAVITAETPDDLVAAMRGAQRNVGSLSKLGADATISANRIRESVS